MSALRLTSLCCCCTATTTVEVGAAVLVTSSSSSPAAAVVVVVVVVVVVLVVYIFLPISFHAFVILSFCFPHSTGDNPQRSLMAYQYIDKRKVSSNGNYPGVLIRPFLYPSWPGDGVI